MTKQLGPELFFVYSNPGPLTNCSPQPLHLYFDGYGFLKHWTTEQQRPEPAGNTDPTPTNRAYHRNKTPGVSGLAPVGFALLYISAASADTAQSSGSGFTDVGAPGHLVWAAA